MAIHIVMLLDLEAIQKAQSDEVQLPVCQERPGAHAIADTVCEDLCVGLLQPTFRAECFRIRSNIRVYLVSFDSFLMRVGPV